MNKARTTTYLSVKYAVSAMTLRRWAKQRKINGRKFGNTWIIDEKSLKEYIVRQRT